MKQILLIVCFLFSVKAFTQVENAVPPAPSSATAYNDFTKKGNFVTREQSDFLERKLETYRDSTSTRIVIVIVDGLKGYTANEFAAHGMLVAGVAGLACSAVALCVKAVETTLGAGAAACANQA